MKKRNMIAALLCSACLVAGSVNPVCRCLEGSNTWSRSYGCPEADNDEIF